MTEFTLKSGGSVRAVYFSLGTTPSTDPDMSCSKAICELFDGAKDSALVSIYSLSDGAIINSMIKAHQRGVNVVVVADYRQSCGKNMNQYIQKLKNAGVPVHIATKQKACMHNKCGIFDSKTVATGSYNWTASGSKRNDENLVILEGRQIARQFTEYVFNRVIENETIRTMFLR